MLALLLVILSPGLSVFASPIIQPRGSSSLSHLALQKVLNDASPIFGYFTKASTPDSSWMSKYPDSTKLIHMNIPGAHDPQTWNYSLATQESLNHVTDLDGNPPAPAEFYRCQEKSFIDMLNAGIRAFDIRYAFDVDPTLSSSKPVLNLFTGHELYTGILALTSASFRDCHDRRYPFRILRLARCPPNRNTPAFLPIRRINYSPRNKRCVRTACSL
jgi:hypothetical protein